MCSTNRYVAVLHNASLLVQAGKMRFCGVDPGLNPFSAHYLPDYSLLTRKNF
jgi:hypothetical protein